MAISQIQATNSRAKKPRSKLMAWELLFLSGVFFIPFDNVKFAPSSGWATLSPYFFCLAFFFSTIERASISREELGKLVKKSALIAGPILLTTVISYILFGANLRHIAVTGIKLLFGFSFFACLVLFSRDRKDAFRIVILALSISYSLSLLMGIAQWLTLALNINAEFIFRSLFYRHYSNRVQFSFTEPSFTSLHIFGVIGIVAAITFPAAGISEIRRLKLLAFIGVTILSISIASGSSVRTVADLVVLLLALPLIFNGRMLTRLKLVALACACLATAALVLPDSTMSRVERAIKSEIDSPDPSAAIRKFRIESSINGLFDNPYSILFGYGFGNTAKAMEIGFNKAYQDLRYTYDEIERLKTNNDGLTYSLPIKILIEHGAIGLMFIYFMIYRRTHNITFLLLFISCIQFDSYAFYSIWLYIYAIYANVGSDKQISSLVRTAKITARPQYF